MSLLETRSKSYRENYVSISYEKLAEVSDLNKNFIGIVEREETNITVKNLEAAANAFKIDIQDLFNFMI